MGGFQWQAEGVDFAGERDPFQACLPQVDGEARRINRAIFIPDDQFVQSPGHSPAFADVADHDFQGIGHD